MTTGEKIIDAIISGSLVHGTCAEDETHGVLCIWSSGAEEQIDAIAEESARPAKETLRKIVKYADMGIEDYLPEWQRPVWRELIEEAREHLV